jgi:membrane protease YdiL (CAAX protease family)
MDEPAASLPAVPVTVSKEYSPARAHFHVALACLFLPVLSWPILLILLVMDFSNSETGSLYRRWTWWLAALVILDVALFVGLFAQRGHDAGPRHENSEIREDEHPRIGINLDPSEVGARIADLQPDSPAARAGLQQGDVIIGVDDIPILSRQDFETAMATAKPGVARKVLYVRGGKSLETSVVPEISDGYTITGLRDLWQQDSSVIWRGAALWLAPSFVIGLLAWTFARRRGAPTLSVWQPFLLILFSGEAAGIAVLFAAKSRMGGYSGLGMLISWGIETLVLLLLALTWRTRRVPAGLAAEPAPPFRSKVWITLRSIFYLATGTLRLGLFLMILEGSITAAPFHFDPIRFLAGLRLGTSGVIMLVSEVVLLGPIAEELLFRGLLLPRLVTQLGPTWALACSALVFASLHQYQGIFMVLTGFGGLILGWARLRSGGIAVPIFIHMLYNATVMIPMLLD